MDDVGGIGMQANLGKESAMRILDNMRCLGDLFFGGVCHRFPEVRFVSVESGVGWLPGPDVRALASAYRGKYSAAYVSQPEGPLSRVHYIIGTPGGDVTLWKGFQRRHATGLSLMHQDAAPAE